MLMYFFIQILLVVLKIKNVIDWGWNVVLIPTWIMLGIFAGWFVLWSVFCICMVIASV